MASWAEQPIWILTWAEPLPEGRLRLHYLMRDGRREAIIILATDDSADLRDELGRAFAANRRRHNPLRSRTQ